MNPVPLATRSQKCAPFVLVSGGKGGVGKTIVTANLGLELARRGLRVLLVDLDLGLANLAVLLRIAARHDIEDALRGRCALGDCIVAGPNAVDVLPASSGTLDMARLEPDERARLWDGLREISERYDVVLGDGAAGIGPDVLAFCAAADHVLLVTTPDAAALTDAYGLIKALHAYGEQVEREVATPEVIVNQAGDCEEAERTSARLRAVCERFLARSPHSAGWLPSAPEVARSARKQVPFALAPLADGAGLARACLRQLASRVERLAGGTKFPPSRVLRA